MPTGLGSETQWLCPTLNNTSPLSDLSGNGNNASQIGTIATTPNTEEGGLHAYDFTGHPNGIDSEVPRDNGATDLFSYSMWIKADSVTTRQRLVTDSGNSAQLMLTLNAGGVISASFYDGAFVSKSSAAISASQWYHIYCSHDSGTTKLYLDGVEQSGTFNAGGGNGDPNVLYGYNSNRQTLAGLMDDVRKHDRVLTQAEITHLATSRGVQGSPGGAANYSPFRNAKYINKTYQIPRFG